MTQAAYRPHRIGAGARSRIVVAAFVLAFGIAGCGGDGADDTSTTPPATGTAGTTTNGPPAPTVTDAQTEASPPTVSGVAVVDAITTTREDTFDRIVIAFTAPPGPWSTAFRPTVTEDPSDLPITVQGTAFLAVTVQSATLDNQLQVTDGVEHRRFTGTLPMTSGDLGNVREIARAGDFEATLTLAVGMDHTAGVRVSRPAPDRIAIDIAH